MMPAEDIFARKLDAVAADNQANFRVLAAAVSGGADSLALAWLLNSYCHQRGIKAVVLTVNHHLRAAADKEAEMVATLMKKWGTEHHILNWYPPKELTGVEEKAREARYRLMEEWCVQNGVSYLLTAHHLRDQAETFLMRLERGSGVDGLSAMAGLSRRGKIFILRPLLETDPQDLRQLLSAEGISWAEDESNDCDDFLRVRIRKFLPELEQKTGITVRRLADAAFALRQTRSYLEEVTAAFIRSRVRRYEGPAVSISPQAFLKQHREIRLRVLSRLIRETGGRDYPPEYKELLRLDTALGQGDFAGRTLGGCEIVPFMKRWWIIRESKEKRPVSRSWWEEFVNRHPAYKQIVIPYKLKCLLAEKNNGGETLLCFENKQTIYRQG